MDNDNPDNWPLCAVCGKKPREGKHSTDLGEGHDYVPAEPAAPEDAKVEFLASDECLAGLVDNMRGNREPDFTVTAVSVIPLSGGLLLRWETKSAGFGEIAISATEDGVVSIDTECMGAAFTKSVFAKMIDDLLAKPAQETTEEKNGSQAT